MVDCLTQWFACYVAGCVISCCGSMVCVAGWLTQSLASYVAGQLFSHEPD